MDVPAQRLANITMCDVLHKPLTGAYVTERLISLLDDLYERPVPGEARNPDHFVIVLGR